MNETEIKLTPSIRTQLKLQASLAGGDVSAILSGVAFLTELNSWQITAEGVDEIVDIYWDTDTFHLFRKALLFRIRKDATGIHAYVKRQADGSNDNGIFERIENKLKLSSEEALAAIYNSCSAERRRLLPEFADRPFRQVLQVVNTRHRFGLRRGPGEYELVIDFFIYSSPWTRITSSVQGEIEIEARNDEGRNEISKLMSEINFLKVKASVGSKYERGVRCLHLTWPKRFLRMIEWIDTPVARWLLAVFGLIGFVLGIISFALRIFGI